MASTASQLPGVEITATTNRQEEILTPDALKFVVDLERRFGSKRRELLQARVARQARLDAGEHPDFPAETAEIRKAKWIVSPLPADLLDRRVEITGPTDRKMVINALNSGASTYMADFEDANTPTWSNLIEGHINLKDAIRRTITYSDPSTGKAYKLNPTTAVLILRPRGWHLPENHVRVDGQPMAGAFFDFGLYMWHNAKELLARGTGPYFYLPKLESYLEARLWNDIFVHTEATLGLKRGTIKGTVLIETILAAFEMDEILYELREHSSGLNAGRWDYIFSFIKKFASDPNDILPDRGKVTMTTHFLSSYAKLLIKICHNREVHAMGGMSAYIPNKRDPQANQIAMDQVRADKEREATIGHDGTWVAHPGLVALAKEVFDKYMPKPNQIDRKLEDFHCTAADLLQVPKGDITEAGLRQNIAVGIGYMESWLRGTGCVPLFNLMEDAATAEISRAQLWQWVHYKAKMSDGRPVTRELALKTIDEELAKMKQSVGEAAYKAGRYEDAANILRNLIEAPKFVEFLTLPAYDRLNAMEKAAAGHKS
jgi:malate synthase